MKLNIILIVYTTPRTKEQKSALEKVKEILKKYDISFKLANRDKLNKNQFKDKKLVIAVGGDGTFLRAAQFIDKGILLGVNAEPKNKEGFFMKADKKDFEAELKKIIKGKITIKKFLRLEAYINNKRIGVCALNEFFIGPKKSYHAAKYLIMAKGIKERQKSSGILITTPAGSYAWASACCNKRLAISSKSYQLVVREPYEGRVFKNYKLRYAILNKNQKVKIISEMLDGILVADSVGKEHSLKNGSKAVIKLSKNYLKTIWE